MSWVILVAVLRLGIIPAGGFFAYDSPGVIWEAGTFTQRITVEAQIIEHIRLWGGVQVFDQVTESWTLRPLTLWSFIGAEGILGPVSAGLLYQCAHPVVPYQWVYQQKAAWDAARLEVYAEVRIGGD